MIRSATVTTTENTNSLKKEEKKVVKTDEKKQEIFTRAVIAVTATGVIAYAVHKEYVKIPFSSAISQFFARLLGLFSGNPSPTITNTNPSPAASKPTQKNSPTTAIQMDYNSTTAIEKGDSPTAFGLPANGDPTSFSDFIHISDNALESLSNFASSVSSEVNYYWNSFVRNSWNLGVTLDQGAGQFIANPKQTIMDTTFSGALAAASVLHPYLPGPESIVTKFGNKVDDILTAATHLPKVGELADKSGEAIYYGSAIATVKAFDIAQQRRSFIADHNQLPISYYVGTPALQGIQHGTIALGTLIYEGVSTIADTLYHTHGFLAKIVPQISTEAGRAYGNPTGYVNSALPRLATTVVETMFR